MEKSINNFIREASQKGQIIEGPGDIVKDPYVLEFLGLDERTDFSESELESRLVDHLQEFLLELGTGFAFVARQKRFFFEEGHFRAEKQGMDDLLYTMFVFDRRYASSYKGVLTNLWLHSETRIIGT